MTRKRLHIILVLALLTAWCKAAAADFAVASFRHLSNDVSAFIDPVKDLNDEDCALIKVQAPEEFAFSTPLGIVRRLDKTGEIWLYIPARSKKITIKHPRWGVMRDYAFPERIDSHMTYELTLDMPRRAETAPVQTIIETVRDTLTITQVDTVIIVPEKPRVPVTFPVMATVSFGGKSSTVGAGIFAGVLKNHGAFVHAVSNFGRVGRLEDVCDRNGQIDGRTPYYSAKTRHRFYMVNAGAMHRLSASVNLFEGIGYGSDVTAWQLAESEGGARVKNSYYSAEGISFEVGITFRYKPVALMASVSSVKGKAWYGSIGIGFTF